jgi:hypothetical protein
MKMADTTYDILPNKDIQKVKSDLKDIKKKLTKKPTLVEDKKVYKVLPHKTLVGVKKDITEIKDTINRKAKQQKPAAAAKATKFDNYYDMLPHKKIRELDLQIRNLKEKLRKKQDKVKPKKKKVQANPAVVASMRQLSDKIARLLQIFEAADKALGGEGTSTTTTTVSNTVLSAEGATTDITPLAAKLDEIKTRLDELSAENEEMAKGILVIAEMLKENPPVKKAEEPTPEPSPEPKQDDFKLSFGSNFKSQLDTLDSKEDTGSQPYSRSVTAIPQLFDDSFNSGLPEAPKPDGLNPPSPPKPDQGNKRRTSLF